MNRNMLKQAQQMQAKLAQIQEEIAITKTESTSGGGAVKVIVIGTSKIESNYIVCRAFKKLPHILNISRENCVKKHKIIIMKGRNAQQEINNTSMMKNYKYRLENSITDSDSKIIILNTK